MAAGEMILCRNRRAAEGCIGASAAAPNRPPLARPTSSAVLPPPLLLAGLVVPDLWLQPAATPSRRPATLLPAASGAPLQPTPMVAQQNSLLSADQVLWPGVQS